MDTRRWLTNSCVVAAGLGLVALACSADGDGSAFDDPAAGAGGGTAGTGGSGGMINTGANSGSGAGGILGSEPACDIPDTSDGDADGDGFAPIAGDCNDCTNKMNPGAYDFFGNGVDEDCNQVPDDEPGGCDTSLPIDGNNPLDAARAIGLCRFTTPDAQGPQRTWGVVSATYVFADGSVVSGVPDDNIFGTCTGPGGQGSPPNPLSHGVLPGFGNGVAPRNGGAMLALSSGVARSGVNGDSPGGAYMCTQSPTPPGFPTPSTAACPGQDIDDTPVANDPIALELKIRTPTNALSLAFDFDFYTYEYPDYICTMFNDFFVALLMSQHADVPPNRNISFDSAGNPVSVNNGFLEVCSPGNYGGKNFACQYGTGELMGTGFEDHAATGWLQTSAPVLSGEDITLRFAIWDMGDEILDSTVLIDNFRWDVEQGTPSTERPPK